MLENPNDPLHGTPTGYYYGCRCERCKQAESDYLKKRRKRYLYELEENPIDPRHGTPYGYNLGCRCEFCRRADKLHRYELEKQKRDAS